LQRLRTLHVSVNFFEAIGDVVTSGAWVVSTLG
jgi:hypothetical protein